MTKSSTRSQTLGFQITAEQRGGYEFDLTHGHPYRTPLAPEMEAFACLDSLLASPTDMRDLKVYEREFIGEFMAMSGQEPLEEEGRFVYPSASHSIMAAAITFASSICPKNEQYPVAQFVSPVFDNIPGLFELQGFQARYSVEENNFWLPRRYSDDHGPDFADDLTSADVLVLVTPNNPTGFQLKSDELRTIAEMCKVSRTALCVDRTFFNFPEGYSYEMHGILANSGVSYAIIDDTGKLWASKESKLSILTTSPDLDESATKAHNTLQLAASPVFMKVFADLIRRGGALKEIRQLLSTNRELLLKAFSESDVFDVAHGSYRFSELPVEQVSLDGFEAGSAVRALGNLGVGVVAIREFQPDIPDWAKTNPDMLPRFRRIRVALSRDSGYIELAAERIALLKPGDCEPVKNRLRP